MATIQDPARLQDIAKSIYALASGIVPLRTDKLAANEALQGAVNAEYAGREGVLLALARLALAENWTLMEIDAASKRVAKMSNSLDAEKAVATFIGDAKCAMHPNVRTLVPRFMTVRDEVWEAEAALPKDAARPAKKAFARGYHMLKQMMVEARDNGRVISDVSEAMDWAIERDPDCDADRVHKRLQGLIETVNTFGVEFPVAGFTDIVEFMKAITKDALTEARKGLVAERNAVTEAHRLAPVVVAPASTTVVEEAAPAVDPVAEFFRDDATLQAVEALV